MTTSLKRGENLEFCRDSCDLSQITIGLGWDVATPNGEIPAPHYPGTARTHLEHDLDAVALLLNQAGKIAELGGISHGHSTTPGDVIFHKAPRHASGAIWLTGDNRTGAGDADSDDEQIIVKLDAIDAAYHRIVFLVVIHDGRHRAQHFGQVKNAYIRALDAQGRIICRYDISDEHNLADCSAMTFAEVVRHGEGWQFRALGVPHQSDRFAELLKPWL
jgi:stress response protein SCP2